MSSGIVYEFEHAAMKGEAMPKDLSLPDQLLFQALSLLYKRYYAGQISRDDAAAEKRKLNFAHELQVKKLARYERLERYYSQQQEAIYLAHGRYMKDRTLENAELLSKTLNGFVRLNGVEAIVSKEGG